jgi:hypothetical protein
MGPRYVLIIAWIRGTARTEDLGSWLGAEVLFVPWVWQGLPLPRRLVSWLRSGLATVKVVRQHRRATIVVVEPPVFAYCAPGPPTGAGASCSSTCIRAPSSPRTGGGAALSSGSSPGGSTG